MRLHILSDLHLEFRRDSWRDFVRSIPSGVGDVLVLAGDVVLIADVAVREMLASFRSKAPEVVYVLGNHEHYHGDFAHTKEVAADLCRDVGLHLLDGEVRTVAGRRFVGATLWFRRSAKARRYRNQMMDFQLIASFEDAVYDDNRRVVEALRREVKPGDIVVTHHLPTRTSVAPQFRSGPESLLNPFFVCDCDDIIAQSQPALWIHGHTHEPCDHQLGATRIVCNPIGYPGESARAAAGRLGFYVDV